MRLEPFLSTPLVWEIEGALQRDALFSAIAQKVAVEIGKPQDQEIIFNALLSRELISPSLMASGTAFPHAMCDSLTKTILAVVHVADGVQYQQTSASPARIIFAVLGPKSSEWEQMRLIARAFRLCRIPKFLKRLQESNSAAELMKLLLEEDKIHV